MHRSATTTSPTSHNPRSRQAMAAAVTRWMLLMALMVVGGSIVSQANAQPAPEEADRASARLMEGIEAYHAGNYRSAWRDLRRVLRETADSPNILPDPRLARAFTVSMMSQADAGEYADAVEIGEEYLLPLLAPSAEARPGLAPAIVAFADLLLQAGRSDEAQSLLTGVLDRQPNHLLAAEALGRLKYLTGQSEAAAELLGNVSERQPQSVDQTDDPTGDKIWNESREWLAIGRARYYLEKIDRQSRLQRAIDAFETAREVDINNLAAYAWGGRVYLEAQQQADARVRWFEEALTRNPSYVPARAGVARTYYFEWQSYRGREEALTAYQVSETHVDSLRIMAEVRFNEQRYDAAMPFLERLVAAAPLDLEAQSMLGLAHLHLGDRPAYEAVRDAVLEQNPGYSDFFAIVADGLMTATRLREAVATCEAGLEIDNEDWAIWATLGMTWARLGKLTEAQEALGRANRNDPLRNSLYTINMLQALQVVELTYVEHATEDGRFILRVHRDEEHWIIPLLLRELDEIWADLIAKYDFTPRTPITIEVFQRRDDFAARSIAMPSLPALGVCFGEYVTMLSPTAVPPGSFSWARTLRHELDHVFQIQLSDGRVPRWLAEGCSVYEERRARPEWDRELDQQMIQFYYQDRLLKLETINNAFRTSGLILFGYFQASYMVQFITEELAEGDYSMIRTMLVEFAKDTPMDEVSQIALGMSAAAFDEAFTEYIRRTFIEPTKVQPYYGPADLQRFRLEYEENPENAEIAAKLAAAFLHNGNVTDARNFAGIALRLDDSNTLAWLVWGHIQFRRAQGNPDALRRAAESYQRVLEAGDADFWVFQRLAQIALARRDREQAIEYYEQAKAAFPRYVGQGSPYTALAQLYDDLNRDADAIEELAGYVAINERDIASRQRLVEYYLGQGDRERALLYLEQIGNIFPVSLAYQQQIGELCLEVGRPADAAFHLDLAKRLIDRLIAGMDIVNGTTSLEEFTEADEMRTRIEEALATARRQAEDAAANEDAGETSEGE